jgi:hypothetical protein
MHGAKDRISSSCAGELRAAMSCLAVQDVASQGRSGTWCDECTASSAPPTAS